MRLILSRRISSHLRKISRPGKRDISACKVIWRKRRSQTMSWETNSTRLKMSDLLLKWMLLLRKLQNLKLKFNNFKQEQVMLKLFSPPVRKRTRKLASALTKRENAHLEEMKLAVQFKPIMEKLLKESVQMTTDAMQRALTVSHMENGLIPVATLQKQVNTTAKSLVPMESIGEANKGEKGLLKRRQKCLARVKKAIE